MNKTNSKKPKGKNNDDQRQKDNDDALISKIENREEQSQDGTIDEDELRKFERELLQRHDQQPKLNRSGAIKHSTLVGEEINTREEEEKEEEEKEEEDPSVKILEAKAFTESHDEKTEEERGGTWEDIEESVLTAFLFDEEDRREMQQMKKRKGDSLEINEKFKKEKLEESKKYPEETDREKVQRKMKQILDILNTEGPIEDQRIRMKKLIGEINSMQNRKISPNQTTQGEEKNIRCEQCKIKIEQERQRKETEKIIGIVNKGGDIDTFSQIHEKKWEDKVFEKTKWEHGGLQETIEKKECIIITKNEIKDGGVEGVIRTLREEVAEIIEECKVGDIEYIENVKKSSMANQRRQWYTYVTKVGEQGMYEMAVKAINIIKKREKPPETVRVIVNNEINKEDVRKALEFVGRKENIVWEIVIRGKEMDKGERHEQEEALLIKTGGKSYTDVLKEMNQKIDIGKIGLKVNRLKKTEGGDILVKLKGKGAAEKLKKEMDSKITGMSMAVRKKENYFSITAIDPGFTEEQLISAITTYTGIPEDEIDVKTLRINRHGEQVATIAVRPSKAEELRRYRTIVIGWVICPIMERHTPVRCYKCLHYGHSTYECTGESRVACCYNCFKNGHTAVQCSSTAYCLTCKEEGHRMDRMTCPAYRAWVYGRGGEREPIKH
ncbi:FK506-binding protein 5-like [Diabrotica virgifera virgifera]|uniref:CCHC-type domain-containing protein n=1 Tax=Diabrotica virgifera virgifera TaxID=50390 RepID=A0ABM5KXU0_DIAVI|nr:FK506-binding protein 5-like [Diabrotica virgifera virgifera]